MLDNEEFEMLMSESSTDIFTSDKEILLMAKYYGYDENVESEFD
jgi:hypothetical protein